MGPSNTSPIWTPGPRSVYGLRLYKSGKSHRRAHLAAQTPVASYPGEPQGVLLCFPLTFSRRRLKAKYVLPEIWGEMISDVTDLRVWGHTGCPRPGGDLNTSKGPFLGGLRTLFQARP